MSKRYGCLGTGSYVTWGVSGFRFWIKTDMTVDWFDYHKIYNTLVCCALYVVVKL
jgi:hypothetical protein